MADTDAGGQKKILYVNSQANGGQGFSGPAEIPIGTTVGDLFKRDMPGQDLGKYMIKLNHKETADDSIELQEMDRVVITARNIEGA